MGQYPANCPLRFVLNSANNTMGTDKQRLREICRIAARVFFEKGYEGASMQDIARAVGLTKAGLYHHVRSKDRLLFEIMNYGMDILHETVITKVQAISDPREKLRQTIIGHINLIVHARDQEITVILHENRSLKGVMRRKINARKKEYIRMLEDLIAQVQQTEGGKPLLTPPLATFALLGVVNWLYQWYRPDGPIKEPDLARAYVDFFFRGLLGEAPKPVTSTQSTTLKSSTPDMASRNEAPDVA